MPNGNTGSLWDSPIVIEKELQTDALALLSDYLGLEEDPKLIEKCLWTLDHHGDGSGEDQVQAFIRFFIKKKSGGRREILAPTEPLKGLLRTVSFELLSRYPLARFAHGFRKRRSAITNATAHFKSLRGLKVAYGVNWDIQDCFPSTDLNMIRKVFHRTIGDDLLAEGVNRDVITRVIHTLVHLTTFQYGRSEVPVLPMGAPTSPALLNLVLKGFDLRVARFLRRFEKERETAYTYTRYGDDICITSPDPLPTEVCELGPRLLQAFGYRTNEKKTTRMQRGGSLPPIAVTGLIIGKDRLILSDDWLQKTEMMLIRYLNPTRVSGEQEYVALRGRFGFARKICDNVLPKRLENCFMSLLSRHGPLIQDRVHNLLHGKPKENEESSGDIEGYGHRSGGGWTEEEWAAWVKYVDEIDEQDPVEAGELMKELDLGMHHYSGPDYPEPAGGDTE